MRSYTLILGAVLTYRFILLRLQGEARLDPARFARIHRGYIVNLDLVTEIEPLEFGDASRIARIARNIAVGRGRASDWPCTASSARNPCFA